MKEIKDIWVEENVSLKKYNTYQIDAKTKYFIHIKSLPGFIDILKYLQKENIPYFLLGAGSNVILSESFSGAVLHLDFLNTVTVEDTKVIAGAGTMMGALAKTSIDHAFTGLEWAINIPGTVGGSITGNAGAYNSEMFDSLISIKVLDCNFNILDLPKSAIYHAYRETNIKKLGYIVLEGTFKLEKGDPEESKRLIKDRCERRKETQPLDMPSAGSVFRNPDGDHAGRLIEAAGLKGKRVGGAEVSKKHANFIVNTGGATSNDIKNLIKLIKEEVKKKFHVDLILEQEIVDWK